jgi:two-component system LytT family sensor kinase
MNEEHIAHARKRVRRLRDFYVHGAIYVVVIGGIAVLNWIVNPTFWWVAFPAVGWGIGLAAHAVSVFFEDSLFGAAWEERKTCELLQREGRQSLR